MKLNPSDLAHQDIDVELAKAKHMAQVMDTVLAALAPRTTDTCCQSCGQRIVLAGAQDPLARWVCVECSTPDQPQYRPDTGFGA